MTSNDAPVPAAGPGGRRRVLGRGPGATPPPETPAAASPPQPPGGAPALPAEAEAAASPQVDEASEPIASTEAVGPAARVGAGESPAGGEQPAAVVESVEVVQSEAVAVSVEVVETEAVAASVEVVQSEAVVEPFAVDGLAGAVPGAAVATRGTRDVGADAVPAPSEGSDEADDGVFKVRLSNFEGPFDLLLQLISKHKLDVTEVALSRVTDEFMAHIRAMGPDWDLDQTTEFLVVAATLLDLKAARLLPAAEVEDEADLALLEARDLLFARLLQYRAYKQIADIFNARLEEEARRYPRTVGLEDHHAELLPEVVISIGPEGFAKLAVKAMQPKPKPQVYVDHIHAPLVSVQEQAGIVVARLRELGEASFRALVEDTDDTLTVVARFLALLELYREKAVALDQEEALGDLLVRWTGGEGDEQPRVTDEFDRPPEEPTGKGDAKGTGTGKDDAKGTGTGKEEKA
ncbi:segregation and condensation protein A [Streptomyces sp. Tue6028]|uniref:segregation and condensation protein A n=1 Tax=Streptomyces sp. Tue6028 TaxID=2036037 RepID=UPI00211BEEBB|nr:segregation/condensation protein A [Streptomyces sp. Tue6028]